MDSTEQQDPYLVETAREMIAASPALMKKLPWLVATGTIDMEDATELQRQHREAQDQK